jgi:hypothetical protein
MKSRALVARANASGGVEKAERGRRRASIEKTTERARCINREGAEQVGGTC